ncbi:hypothetical protein ADZ36_04195 [Streptomyces fradiae]|uniref:Uncharacterized protein n=3 Tax=Streptomyces TaxID=1883 RepID=A0A3R7IYE7_9ACTN|nr:hypothetical protein ADZ36_04195 [Streptomyces fradiae]OFA34108.1 hypothetical protein BEN35_31030 [Streptomyces fradiae]PQM25176.1 hypothetical protein Sfr7A_03295 [Streptomyces xinghaiensis]RKM99227.1 hypothetical protein SFRA_003295 [Streptomyces xinghaiensis]RNC75869.1 hypothetical protein DC095_001080 [Streptomyces xinghaiensis]
MTACQSDGEATPLSLNGLTETADGVPDDGTDTCPLPYDMGRAAQAAGLDAEAGPGPVRDDDEPVATAEGGKRAESGEPLAVNPGALVTCTFHVGRDDVEVHTVATREPSALAPLAPVVSRLAAVSSDELIGYIDKAGKAEPGEAVVTGSGNVAAVRLRLDGDGDAALLVGAGESGTASLDRKQIGDLTRALADQVR